MAARFDRVYKIAFHASVTLSALAMPIAASAQTVAFVQLAAADGKWVDWRTVAQVLRGSKPVRNPAASFRIEPGDQVVVERPGAVVVVHTIADNATIFVRQKSGGKPGWVARGGSLLGSLGTVIEWFETAIAGADMSRLRPNELVTAATLGPDEAKACYNDKSSNEPTSFEMPIFAAPSSSIAAGNHSLLVPWRGGVAPFKVTLTDRTNLPVGIPVQGVTGTCVVRLPSIDLKPGRYTLAVRDANGSEVAESNLVVGDVAIELLLDWTGSSAFMVSAKNFAMDRTLQTKAWFQGASAPRLRTH